MIIKLCVVFSLFTMSKCYISDFFPDEIQGNLTSITWAHAVNNHSLLLEALKSHVMMLEADVSLGKVDNSGEDIPIMSHGGKESDLSLEQFLNNVTTHNNNTENNKKGVKLDFKSIDAFTASGKIITSLTDQAKYPVWLNADILQGPINATVKTVDPTIFLNACKTFPNNVVLSLGWTTNYNETLENKFYTDPQIDEMLAKIKDHNITQPITFAVRAVFAAESMQHMKNLTESVLNSTLTIWSSAGDLVDFEKLEKLIFEIGLDKVYVDMPEDQMAKLHLESSSNRAGNFGVVGVLLATLVMLATCKLM